MYRTYEYYRQAKTRLQKRYVISIHIQILLIKLKVCDCYSDKITSMLQQAIFNDSNTTGLLVVAYN